jgi:glutathione S-transferase
VLAVLRVHRIPFSTNVERVALAAGLKGLEVEWVDHPAGDRRAVVELSGQDLVPVLETPDGDVLTDSPRILRWLEERHPEPPLLPADPAARRAVEAFCDWFNHVWKIAPNAIDAHRRAGRPDDAQVAGWAEQLRAAQRYVEALLAGRDFLLGAEVSLADVTAAPFLRFTTSGDPDDDDLFHGVLLELLPGDLPRMAAWIDRMAALPRA